MLVEVYGEGILILGDSGIGKSELAIELVKRGHRLVADDAVELRKVSNRQIMGTAPENIRHFIELRGIGIVNVARVFGVGAVKVSESSIWSFSWRLGTPPRITSVPALRANTTNSGRQHPQHQHPCFAGTQPCRCAGDGSINNRQKKMGYNAAKELLIRLGLDGTME